MQHTQSPYTFGRGPQGIIARWTSLLFNVFNPYRPELHYMRGPGPRWRARHGRWSARVQDYAEKRKGRWALRHRPSLAAAGSRSPVPLQIPCARL